MLKTITEQNSSKAIVPLTHVTGRRVSKITAAANATIDAAYSALSLRNVVFRRSTSWAITYSDVNRADAKSEAHHESLGGSTYSIVAQAGGASAPHVRGSLKRNVLHRYIDRDLVIKIALRRDEA
jgi:hypothetical protein